MAADNAVLRYKGELREASSSVRKMHSESATVAQMHSESATVAQMHSESAARASDSAAPTARPLGATFGCRALLDRFAG